MKNIKMYVKTLPLITLFFSEALIAACCSAKFDTIIFKNITGKDMHIAAHIGSRVDCDIEDPTTDTCSYIAPSHTYFAYRPENGEYKFTIINDKDNLSKCTVHKIGSENYGGCKVSCNQDYRRCEISF